MKTIKIQSFVKTASIIFSTYMLVLLTMAIFF
ncbi:hypothetical protein Palpr_0540 [Paludibacter propionicigenes WB4]|uniref:Uncharacterized protein n=1 Tax=Paludibacter propionicigenes (strain DSM 17365 / JCM 13257 / WB4) TaxID=694427 RepID=E4T1V5_PALPW|nr:hypothetical protein Palpr_0540 [Paludibacter propionicigenes WB4]